MIASLARGAGADGLVALSWSERIALAMEGARFSQRAIGTAPESTDARRRFAYRPPANQWSDATIVAREFSAGMLSHFEPLCGKMPWWAWLDSSNPLAAKRDAYLVERVFGHLRRADRRFGDRFAVDPVPAQPMYGGPSCCSGTTPSCASRRCLRAGTLRKVAANPREEGVASPGNRIPHGSGWNGSTGAATPPSPSGAARRCRVRRRCARGRSADYPTRCGIAVGRPWASRRRAGDLSQLGAARRKDSIQLRFHLLAQPGGDG